MADSDMPVSGDYCPDQGKSKRVRAVLSVRDKHPQRGHWAEFPHIRQTGQTAMGTSFPCSSPDSAAIHAG
jgi:hypothetical protein